MALTCFSTKRPHLYGTEFLEGAEVSIDTEWLSSVKNLSSQKSSLNLLQIFLQFCRNF